MQLYAKQVDKDNLGLQRMHNCHDPLATYALQPSPKQTIWIGKHANTCSLLGTYWHTRVRIQAWIHMQIWIGKHACVHIFMLGNSFGILLPQYLLPCQGGRLKPGMRR